MHVNSTNSVDNQRFSTVIDNKTKGPNIQTTNFKPQKRALQLNLFIYNIISHLQADYKY